MSQQDLTELTTQVAQLSKNVEFLVNKQKKTEELFEEMMPIAKLAMAASVRKLDELDQDGTIAFTREVANVGKRIVEGFSPADVQQLGDAVVGILDSVRALTQPEVLRLAKEATEVLGDIEEVQPIGLFGMARATKNADVQRGMAVMMEVLKRIGHGVHAMEATQGKKKSRKESLARMLGPSRKKALGTERQLPSHVEKPIKKRAAPTSEKVAAPAKETVTIDGIEFDSDGHMVDAAAWTPEVGAAIATAEGIELTDAHWALINAARKDFLDTGASPNIRRLTSVADVKTRDIYNLFPKAPGRSIARISGCPKPVGCL